MFWSMGAKGWELKQGVEAESKGVWWKQEVRVELGAGSNRFECREQVHGKDRGANPAEDRSFIARFLLPV